MRISHKADIPANTTKYKLDGGGAYGRTRRPEDGPDVEVMTSWSLMSGESGAPDMFEFFVVDVPPGLESPRHVHNFDQIRFALTGAFKLGPNLHIPDGGVAYTGAGSWYGPYVTNKRHTVANLQFGSANGIGLERPMDDKAAIAALKKRGRFEGGHYFTTDKAGKERKQVAWAAVWAEAHGEEFVPPTPRIAITSIMQPESYQWIPGDHGTSEKTLGVFDERGTAIRMLHLEPGAHTRRRPRDGRDLAFVLEGRVRVDGEVCERHDTVCFEPSEDVKLHAVDETTLYLFSLPGF